MLQQRLTELRTAESAAGRPLKILPFWGHKPTAAARSASPYDRIWGLGIAPTNPDAYRPSVWRGLNLLGFALMDVRDRLRTTQQPISG